jgi:hypothetical protein
VLRFFKIEKVRILGMALRQAQDRGLNWIISGGNGGADALYTEVTKRSEKYGKVKKHAKQ